MIACWAPCAQGSPIDTRPDDYIVRAKQFFRKLYPGLDRNVRAVITDGHRLRDPDSLDPDLMNVFRIELYDLELKHGVSPPASWCSSPVLGAEFVFDWQTGSKELVIFAVGGPLVDASTSKFVEAMKKHPGWSDAQVITALNDAGARFGPDHKAAFLRALPIQELKPFVGELEVVSADFHLRMKDGEGKPSAVNPYWYVQARWHGPGREARCALMFEAFEGKLTSILRL